MAREDIAVTEEETVHHGGHQAAPEQQPAQPAFGEPQQASPEEQELYDKIVAQAFNLIYDRKFMPQVLGMLAGEGDPVEGLARVAALVIGRVATSAERAGQKLSGDVLLHAGTEIFEDLAELSREAGIKDFSQDSDAFEGAFFRALDQFRVGMQEAGRINQGAAARDMEMLQQIDQSGELEGLFTQFAEEDARRKAGEQPEEAA